MNFNSIILFIITLGLELILSSPSSVLAKDATTIVYKNLESKSTSFLILSAGRLSERKEIEDSIEKKLSGYKVLKSYMVIPPAAGKLSDEDLKAVLDKISSESINTFLVVERNAVQGDTRCTTIGQATTSDYGMPELGQYTTSNATVMCSADHEWTYQITVRDIALNKVSAVSELRSSDLGYGDQLAIELGGKLSKKMIERMLTSLIKNKAF